jgi:hypothetical protein
MSEYFETKVEDLYKEHQFHTLEKFDNCSECYKEREERKFADPEEDEQIDELLCECHCDECIGLHEE